MKNANRMTLCSRLLLLGLVVSATACTSMDYQRERYPEPDDRLNLMLTEYDKAKTDGSKCFELWEVDHATTDCKRIQREVARLYAEFPEDERVLISNAALQFEDGRRDSAQFYLDQLLAMPGSHPEATVLRSQIAMEDGNTTLALELLERQIMLAPNRHELREAQAAAYYLKGQFDKSRVVLAIAGRIGTPGWRLSYHHGLLHEAEKNWVAACTQYNLALEQKPDFTPAQARLIGLSEHEECRNMLFEPHVGDATRPAGMPGVHSVEATQ